MSSTISATVFVGTRLSISSAATVATLSATSIFGTNLSANLASLSNINAGSVSGSIISSNNFIAPYATITNLFSTAGSFNTVKSTQILAGTFTSSTNPLDSTANLVVSGSNDARLLIRGKGTICGVDFEPTGTYNGAGNVKSLRISALDDGANSAHLQISQRIPGTITNALRSTLYLNSNGNLGINSSDPAYSLDVNGDIAASGNVYATNFIQGSDECLKTNIQPIENPVEKIKKLQGITYSLKKDVTQKRQIGLVAQEVEKAGLQEIVYELKDGTKGLDYTKLVALLIEAIKSQQEQLDSLQT